MDHLNFCFMKAREAYPSVFTDTSDPCMTRYWKLVDADAESGDRSRAGMLVLQEWRGDDDNVYNHWGFQIPRFELLAHLRAVRLLKESLDILTGATKPGEV